MKKSGIAGLIMCLMLGTASVTEAKATNKAENTITTEKNAGQLVNRLKEIKSMDIKSMNSAEKKELRNEVLSIKKQMKSQEPVLYISLGAALLVVLLLVLLV